MRSCGRELESSGLRLLKLGDFGLQDKTYNIFEALDRTPAPSLNLIFRSSICELHRIFNFMS